MKLAIVSHQVARNDGQGRVNYEIALGALSMGWDVTIIAMRCADDLRRRSDVRFVNLNFERWPTQLLRNLAFAIASAMWIKRNRGSVDILHVNGGLTWADADVNAAHFVHSAWLKNSFFPFPHWLPKPYDAYQRFYTLASAKLEMPAFRRARSVVAVSTKVSNELEEIGIPKENIRVICNGVDTDEFRPGTPDRERFGLPIESTVFLFAGDIRTSRKNLETVLKALIKVKEVHLAVAGETTGSPFIQLAVRLGLVARVHFLGAVKDMSTLMRSVDALVFPSRYDPAGLVVLEAMASGLPVITAKTAGASELIRSAGRSLDNPNDVETLAVWMCELRDDIHLRRAMGYEGRSIALQYTWESMARQYRSLYTQLFAGRATKLTREARLSTQTQRD